MQCCNIHVIIYSSARVSEFIRAIRSFISIDISHFVWFQRICDSMKSVSSFSSIDNLEMGLMKAPGAQTRTFATKAPPDSCGQRGGRGGDRRPNNFEKKKLNII